MNPLDRHIVELEDLIDLAEKVSNNIDALVKRRNRIKLFMILPPVSFFLLIAMISTVRDSLSVLSMGTAITVLCILLCYTYILWKEHISIDDKIKRESSILRKLLNMIHPFQESLPKMGVSIMRKSIIEMKLSRIKFSNIEDPKPTRQKKQAASPPKEPATSP